MAKENSFLNNASLFFDKIMKQTYISKSEILSLKKKLKVLKEADDSYTNLFNRITNIGNKAGGKNSPNILTKEYEDFKKSKTWLLGSFIRSFFIFLKFSVHRLSNLTDYIIIHGSFWDPRHGSRVTKTICGCVFFFIHSKGWCNDIFFFSWFLSLSIFRLHLWHRSLLSGYPWEKDHCLALCRTLSRYRFWDARSHWPIRDRLSGEVVNASLCRVFRYNNNFWIREEECRRWSCCVDRIWMRHSPWVCWAG